ncbi:hypothetical protein COO20_09835 [Thalassospira marina]|uniref:Uncharacterized protein n=1 Tax=Thalassospira marina TaxID=2048283 RepID=A0A2N3KV89_9PROT|nr:hypothetical protein COO20_09835 [Thalassospira marina]
MNRKQITAILRTAHIGRIVVSVAKVIKDRWQATAIFAFILMLLVFFIFRKTILAGMAGSPWNELRSFQWETVFAGCLGLAGGYLALTAVRWQDKKQQHRLLETCQKDLNQLKVLINSIKNARDALLHDLKHCIQLLESVGVDEETKIEDIYEFEWTRQETLRIIKILIDNFDLIQNAVRQITNDFRTVISLINRTNINYFAQELPFQKYKEIEDEIASFSNPYRDEKINCALPTDSQKDRLCEQFTKTLNMIDENDLGDTTIFQLYIDLSISDIERQLQAPH